MKFFMLLLSILALTGHAAASAAAIPDGPDRSAWPAAPLPDALELDGASIASDRSSVNPRLDAALVPLVQSADDRVTMAEKAGLRYEDGRVQVQIVVGTGDEIDARAAVIALGGEITSSFEDTLQAWLPPERLADLALQPIIEYIHSPNLAVVADSEAIAASSEGLAPANATEWQAAGWRGQGVRIAIIDAGFTGYFGRLGFDLPDEVIVKNFVDGQPDSEVGATTSHGTACAEIVHDMAPLAELYLLKISTDLDLNEAVDYAISQGVDIISTSLTFVNATPGDGTGRFASMAQKAQNAGIIWVTAAGNYRETHWSGSFNDADGDGLHEYAPGVEVNVFGPGNNTAFQIPSGVVLSPSIRWNDWTALNQDYRLLLLRYNGSTFDIVTSNNNPQTGLPGQRPTERIVFVTGGPAAIYGVAVQRMSGTRAVHLELFTPNRELDRRVPAMSLGNLADVPTVVTTAAVDVDVPFVREDYSSEGPTNGPGGGSSGGQLKPNLTAFANVSTASFGTRAFNGTSAATPHVAGAAAQVLSSYPTAQPGEVQDFLQSRAINQGPPGPDNQFGFGRLNLGAPFRPLDYDNHLFVPVALVRP